MIVNNKKISLSSYFKAHKIILLILILDFFGIWVPRFCYHRKLSSSGNCRMCLIEVKGSLKPLVACCTIVHSKMIVYTNTILIRKSREFIMEFLLINHPLDCPICDQSGECDLQDLSCVFGTDASRFIESKKAILNKQLGSLLIRTNMNRCIYCTRCVRYTSEINNTYLFNTLGRGNKTEIGNYNLKDIHRSNYIDGNVLDLCPVGALTGKAYSFRNKVWEQISIESVDILDSACSNIRIDLRNNIIERILPRTNDNLNEEWITNKIRFCYDGFRKQRLSLPFYKIKKINKIFSNSYHCYSTYKKDITKDFVIRQPCNVRYKNEKYIVFKKITSSDDTYVIDISCICRFKFSTEEVFYFSFFLHLFNEKNICLKSTELKHTSFIPLSILSKEFFKEKIPFQINENDYILEHNNNKYLMDSLDVGDTFLFTRIHMNKYSFNSLFILPYFLDVVSFKFNFFFLFFILYFFVKSLLMKVSLSLYVCFINFGWALPWFFKLYIRYKCGSFDDLLSTISSVFKSEKTVDVAYMKKGVRNVEKVLLNTESAIKYTSKVKEIKKIVTFSKDEYIRSKQTHNFIDERVKIIAAQEKLHEYQVPKVFRCIHTKKALSSYLSNFLKYYFSEGEGKLFKFDKGQPVEVLVNFKNESNPNSSDLAIYYKKDGKTNIEYIELKHCTSGQPPYNVLYLKSMDDTHYVAFEGSDISDPSKYQEDFISYLKEYEISETKKQLYFNNLWELLYSNLGVTYVDSLRADASELTAKNYVKGEPLINCYSLIKLFVKDDNIDWLKDLNVSHTRTKLSDLDKIKNSYKILTYLKVTDPNLFKLLVKETLENSYNWNLKDGNHEKFLEYHKSSAFLTGNPLKIIVSEIPFGELRESHELENTDINLKDIMYKKCLSEKLELTEHRDILKKFGFDPSDIPLNVHIAYKNAFQSEMIRILSAWGEQKKKTIDVDFKKTKFDLWNKGYNLRNKVSESDPIILNKNKNIQDQISYSDPTILNKNNYLRNQISESDPIILNKKNNILEKVNVSGLKNK